jgi:acyl carrier protein
MGTKEIKKKVLFVIATILNQKFDLDSEIEAEKFPEWNSLKHIEIIFALEDEFGIQFSEEELATLGSLSTIIDAIHKRMSDEA